MSAVTPRLGFCQRCGDPISGKLRCSRCGGTSKEPRVLPTALPAARKLDPWANRYVDASLPSSCSVEEEYIHDQRPPLSPKRSTYDPQLGFGMPSRISRDLRSSIPVQSDRNSDLKPPPTEMQRTPSQDYSAPLVKGSDGVLSKVCGSLVEPDASRNRWSCTGCCAIFARDSTLYAAPSSSLSGSEGYFCRDCYSNRYSLGECRGCKKAVLGSTKQDGKFVKAESGIWHGRCWKCSVCSKGGGEGVDVLVGMDGEPTCEGCFDRPKRRVVEVERKEEVVPDVRRITRVGATRTGPMGATIAELTKKLGQQTVASPRIPFSTRSGSNTSNITASSSNSSNDMPRSPSKYSFPNHVPTSPGKSGMTRSGSITGSPPKPRPLTAQFRDGLNLAAFKSTFGADDETRGMARRDSRSRSASPVKRSETVTATTGSDKLAEKVPGSPCSTPCSSTRLEVVTDATRRRTPSGFPRPLNLPAAEAVEPVEGEKCTLEAASGTVRCASCGLLPFDRSTGSREVVMVTLADDVHMHAECFTCSPCGGVIDGEKSFVRLDAGYAHPQCAPRVTLQVVSVKEGEEAGERSFRSSLGEGRHATHQRELKPSPVPSPAASMGRRTVVPAAYPTASTAAFRRFQPAPPPTPLNPAAGIFSSHNASSTASKYGGMHTCAYCGGKLSHLESSLGPRGTQWHKNCLVCRGVLPQPKDVWRRKAQDVLCGKKLDSGAKVNADGEVRCRDCFGREGARF